MNEEKLNISQELIDNLSVDNLVNLKVEVDELVSELDDIVETCDAALNS